MKEDANLAFGEEHLRRIRVRVRPAPKSRRGSSVGPGAGTPEPIEPKSIKAIDAWLGASGLGWPTPPVPPCQRERQRLKLLPPTNRAQPVSVPGLPLAADEYLWRVLRTLSEQKQD
jgi:hypothetical protein